MISERRWSAFWLLVRVVGWLSWMTWGQALAFQGTVAVVYPETDDPAYRVVFESVIKSLQTVPTAPPTPGGCASEQGFSLHAEVCCAAHQRKKLDHLCPTSPAPPSPMNGLHSTGPGRWRSP